MTTKSITIEDKSGDTHVRHFISEYPELVKEWHPTKNGNLKPSDVSVGSGKDIWWICDKGHEWCEKPYKRVSYNRNCPYCSNNRLLVGFNDLKTTHPKLAMEWHPTKNGVLTPESITQKYSKKIWWTCEKGHEWETTIHNRLKGDNCPYCSNKKVLLGYNDISTTNPEFVKEWHPTKNGARTPYNTCIGSNHKIWWVCEKGHEWKASPCDRIHYKTGCPYCSNKKVLRGYNDLFTTRPDIAKEWHPTKNKNLTPFDVTRGSSKDVWWMCEHGHEWHNSINNRNNGEGCPYCSNKMVMIGYNDLATTHPEYAKEWHPTKNGNKTPSNVVAGSHYKAHWICEKGHEWESRVYSRMDGKHNCPYCSNKKLLVGFNDMETTHPELAKEWHPTKNGTRTPRDIINGSNKHVWWKCSVCGHEWRAPPNRRISNHSGCPKCAEKYSASFPEKSILYYIQKLDETASPLEEKDAKWDIFIHPNILIEYDGSYYHNTNQGVRRDSVKDDIAKSSNRILYRVKDDPSLNIGEVVRDGNVFRFRYSDMRIKNNIGFAEIINTLTQEIYGKTVDVDTKRDVKSIEKLYKTQNF